MVVDGLLNEPAGHRSKGPRASWAPGPESVLKCQYFLSGSQMTGRKHKTATETQKITTKRWKKTANLSLTHY